MEDLTVFHLIEFFGVVTLIATLGLYVQCLKGKHEKLKSEIEDLKKHSDTQGTETKRK